MGIYGRVNNTKLKDNTITVVIKEETIKKAKQNKKYKCPYCTMTLTRDDLINHIEDEHDDMIPEGYSANRVVFNHIYNKTSGFCVVCKKKTDWNDEANKYDRMCKDPKCKQELRKKWEENMIRVRGTINMLEDDDHQQFMLSKRTISGSYRFKDGGMRTFTGSYERKILEFFDLVLNVHSNDIMSPGPVFAYEYDGKEHSWITDIYYIPFNLVIEVKDGGNNPNKRNMETYREKQLYKEKMITDIGTYNYLRLTDNQFDQLISIMAELKAQMIDDVKETKNVIIRINESTSTANALPNGKVFVTQYDVNDSVRFALSNDIVTDKIITVVNGKLQSVSSNILENKDISIYEFTGDINKYKDILLDTNKSKKVNNRYIYEKLSGKTFLNEDQLEYDNLFKYVDINKNSINQSIYESSMYEGKGSFKIKEPYIYNNIILWENVDGYFIKNIDTGYRTKSYKNISDISNNIISILSSKI